jgi:hypothetical protein
MKMSGENESAKERMEKIIGILDDYEKNVGLPFTFDNGNFEKSLPYDDVKEYLEYSNEELRLLTIEECGHIQYQLTKFAMQIQRLSNREVQREQWCNNELYRMLGKVGENYNKFLKNNEKIFCLIHDDSYAMAVQKIREFAQYRMTRLNYISLSIKDVCENIRNVQKIKEREHNG